MPIFDNSQTGGDSSTQDSLMKAKSKDKYSFHLDVKARQYLDENRRHSSVNKPTKTELLYEG